MDILKRIQEAVNVHEPDGYVQWYIDEFSIDCDAEQFWKVVGEALKGLKSEDLSGGQLCPEASDAAAPRPA